MSTPEGEYAPRMACIAFGVLVLQVPYRTAFWASGPDLVEDCSERVRGPLAAVVPWCLNGLSIVRGGAGHPMPILDSVNLPFTL